MKQTKQLPKIFLFLATSFLLGSCQLGKHYTRPQLQLPETLDSTSVDSTSLGAGPSNLKGVLLLRGAVLL